MHIWTLENWLEYFDINEKGHRIGLRLKFDKNVNPKVRIFCKEFAKWVRKEYFFPVRLPIYIKESYRIKARDGETVVGTFFRPFDYYTEPYARIATGDYQELVEKGGEEYAMWAILGSIAHELTHYYQYVNNIILTKIGEERQATMYTTYILNEYNEYCNSNIKRIKYKRDIWKIDDWKKNDKFYKVDKTGIRFRADNNVPPSVCKACKQFLKYLRREYIFPIRVNVFIENKLFIKTEGGSKERSIFCYKEKDLAEAYIKISIGEYQRILNQDDENNALISILINIAYELTHYFQWINGLQLTVIGRKRQATKYARCIVDKYLQQSKIVFRNDFK